MSRSGNRRVAFIPSSRRPGFFGIAVFSRTGVASVVIGGQVYRAGSPTAPTTRPSVRSRPAARSPRSVVVRAAEEVPAAADRACTCAHPSPRRSWRRSGSRSRGRLGRLVVERRNRQAADVSETFGSMTARTAHGAQASVVHGLSPPGTVPSRVGEGLLERPGAALGLELGATFGSRVVGPGSIQACCPTSRSGPGRARCRVSPGSAGRHPTGGSRAPCRPTPGRGSRSRRRSAPGR